MIRKRRDMYFTNVTAGMGLRAGTYLILALRFAGRQSASVQRYGSDGELHISNLKIYQKGCGGT